jgi:hypothetical protein
MEFSIKTAGSSVGPESVAAAVANAQSGSRNILGYAGPQPAAGSDFVTVARTLDATPNMLTPNSFHMRMNNRDCNLGTISATRITKGAGTVNGVAQAQSAPPVGCNGVAFGSLQLPASEQRTTYAQTGNELTTSTGQTAPLAPTLPALGMTSNFASAAQLIGMVFGTTAQGNATGVGRVSNNFTRDGSWCQHVLDGDIAVMEVVLDNGPGTNDTRATTSDPDYGSSNTPLVPVAPATVTAEGLSLAADLARLALTGSCGALTLAGNTYQVRYAPEFFANTAGQDGPAQGNMALNTAYMPTTVDAAGNVLPVAAGSFFSNAMEVVVPRNLRDMANARRTAKVVFRYRKANSPLRGPDDASGAPYAATATTQWFPNSTSNTPTATPADTDDAVMVSGESQQVAVGSEPLIEIVAIIPASIQQTLRSYAST